MTDREPVSLKVDDFDVDGAVREALERMPRSRFLGRTMAAGAAALGAVVVWPALASAEANSNDITILNFALALEYLQASFYTEAERIGALRGALAHQANVVGMHERAHVKAFKQLLGSAAIKEPSFNFHGVTENADAFRSTAVAFEDLATAAYKEQAPLIKSKSYLAGALAIHSVEARHAAWIRRLAGFLPAAHAFDDPLSDAKVVDIVNSTHFVTLKAPQTSMETNPHFTG
ncbi:MAG TPA: ferritin-like domain-containing protein [Solirubrobacteraceae bacterium]|nr:ferritin-like domain-containing protein [Solirubrobacteraceae bacterium]